MLRPRKSSCLAQTPSQNCKERTSAEHDFFAVPHNPARGVARVDDQLGGIDDGGVVVTRVVGGNHHGIVARERLRIERHGFHVFVIVVTDRKSTRLNSSHGYISYA